MFNIMLDKLPTEYGGFPIDTDFQAGVQIIQALGNDELSRREQIGAALSLLFLTKDEEGNALPMPDFQTAVDGLMWYLSDWNHDNHTHDDKEAATDFDVDQWRIYSAFRQFYGINLNTDTLHFWEFMAFLTTLPECAYTRVVDIRRKKLDGKMGKEERSAYIKLKEVYALKKAKATEYTDEQKEAIDEYDRMMEELKKEAEGKKLAADAFRGMVK